MTCSHSQVEISCYRDLRTSPHLRLSGRPEVSGEEMRWGHVFVPARATNLTRRRRDFVVQTNELNNRHGVQTRVPRRRREGPTGTGQELRCLALSQELRHLALSTVWTSLGTEGRPVGQTWSTTRTVRTARAAGAALVVGCRVQRGRGRSRRRRPSPSRRRLQAGVTVLPSSGPKTPSLASTTRWTGTGWRSLRTLRERKGCRRSPPTQVGPFAPPTPGAAQPAIS